MSIELLLFDISYHSMLFLILKWSVFCFYLYTTDCFLLRPILSLRHELLHYDGYLASLRHELSFPPSAAGQSRFIGSKRTYFWCHVSSTHTSYACPDKSARWITYSLLISGPQLALTARFALCNSNPRAWLLTTCHVSFETGWSLLEVNGYMFVCLARNE